MSTAKPLDVAIIPAIRDHGADDPWKPYQEYGVKSKSSTRDWSCYILAKEGELFSVRCRNTTKKLLAVRISVDACYIQQYLLRPNGQAGDTAICHGTGSHSMAFHLVSSLTRVGNKMSRPPSDTGSVKVMVYQASKSGSELPPPEKPTEQLELPVSMDGTFWKLCVRLNGSGMPMGEPSPHAAEIGEETWKQFASINFNYRTHDELFNGRIRGIETVREKSSSPEVLLRKSSPILIMKRKRESFDYDLGTPQKRRDHSPFDYSWNSSISKASSSAKSTPIEPKIRRVKTTTAKPNPLLLKATFPERRQFSLTSLRSGSSTLPNPKIEKEVVTARSEESAVVDPEPHPFIPWPPNSPQAGSSSSGDSPKKYTDPPPMELPPNDPPAVRATESATEVVSLITIPTESPPLPPPPPPQSQPQHPVVALAITPPLTPQDRPELEKSTAASINETDRATAALAAFLEEVSPFKSLGLSIEDLREAGITTLTELKIVARNPEAFRTKIPALAAIRERDGYVWFMFRKGVEELLEEDCGKRPTDNLGLASDPFEKFIRSLGTRECIDSEALGIGLRDAGISTEKDLLVLSHNLEKYTEKIPFLRKFAASNKFDWTIFQVGLEGIRDQNISTPTKIEDSGAGMEGHAYVKWFLDTIDPDKPLGYLASGFIETGLTDRVPLLHIAGAIELAVDAIPFLKRLASGDQLVWAMILVGLENLRKSA